MKIMDKVLDGKHMNIKHDLYLSPFAKYKLYGIFPWIFFISVALVLTTTCQILFIINTNCNYSYQQLILWNNIFLNWDVEGSDTSLVNSFHIFRSNKLYNYIKTTVQRYYDINSNTLDNYEYYYNDYGEKRPIKLYVEYLDIKNAQDKGFKTEYELSLLDLGPFDEQENSVFLDLLNGFSLELKLKHKLDKKFPTASLCYTWDIMQNFQFTDRGPITVSQEIERGICGGDTTFFNNKFLFLNTLGLCLALISIMLNLKSIYGRLKTVSNLKHRASITGVWQSLSFKKRLRFISLWALFNFTANIFQILGTVSLIFNGNITLKVQESIVGFSCFLAWVGMVQYLKPNPNAYTVGNTLTRAFGTLGPYIIGILPIFIAYVFFAMSVLWKTGNYNTLPNAVTLQFAMLNGDSIYSGLSSALSVSNFFGMLYMYTFLVFFICVIHNIFIAIITESYESLKYKPIKRGDESDDDYASPPERSPASSMLQGSPSINCIDKRKGKGIRRYKSKQTFKELLEENILPSQVLDPRTSYYIKKIHKTTKKITKKIEKMSKLAQNDDSEDTDTQVLQEKLRDLLLMDLEQFLDKFKNP